MWHVAGGEVEDPLSREAEGVVGHEVSVYGTRYGPSSSTKTAQHAIVLPNV